MRVLLINPPLTLLPQEIPSVVPPLGLAYIGAVIENSGCEVGILDTVALNWKNPAKIGDMLHFGQRWKDILRSIKQNKPDVVGVSCLFSSQSQNAHKVAELVKTYDHDIPVLMGGAHPSVLPETVLEDDNVDFVVIGEGETTMVEFLDKWSSGGRLRDISGFAYRERERVRRNPRRGFIDDLDSLPLPARHLLPMDEYFKAMTSHASALMRRRFTSMITSRGCPFNCVFCSIHTVWGHKWRPRTPKNVLLEIEHLVYKYRIRELHFEDDNLTLNYKRMAKICDMILERKLDIKWATPNGVAIWTLKRNLLQKMRRSGCYKLSFGIESGDPNTLRFIGKPINLTQAKEIITISNEVGIWTHGFFVIGFPSETLESISQSLKFSIESDLDFASFFIATAYPGTALQDIVDKVVKPKDFPGWRSLRVSSASTNTKSLTSEQLKDLRRQLYTRFFRKRILNYTKPRKLALRLRRIHSKDDVRFLYRLLQRYAKLTKKGPSLVS